jgi:hypothetical protein
LLNNQWVIKETKGEIKKKVLESNEYENNLPESLRYRKAVLREKFMDMSAYIKKTETSNK